MSAPEISFEECGELSCSRIDDDRSALLVAHQGAQVLSYQKAGQPPLIWANERALLGRGNPVRAGVPVCWPWFGNLARNPEAVQAMRVSDAPAPSHGLARVMKWHLLGADHGGDGVTLQFRLLEADGELASWPHSADLQVRIVLADDLVISLTTRNLGSDSLCISQALHAYFAVSDVRQVSVEELAGLRYIDTLEGWQERRQVGALQIVGETDRIYLDTPQRLSIADPGWDRRILIDTSGSRSTVVWNPWIDRAAQLPDMADDGWQGMLCVEPANVLGDAVTLAPGESHTLGLRISSEAL
jgi:glucose-6-phosphate 1-epimerase